MNARRNSLIGCAALALAFLATAPSARAQNLISDPSFEKNPYPYTLPGLGPLVGPPFVPGYWGAEDGMIAVADSDLTPPCGRQNAPDDE